MDGSTALLEKRKRKKTGELLFLSGLRGLPLRAKVAPRTPQTTAPAVSELIGAVQAIKSKGT